VQVDLRSGEERAADKASKLVAVNGPAQLTDAAEAERIVQETKVVAEHAPDHSSQQKSDGHEAGNELAAITTDTQGEQAGPQAASLVVHHVALLDKCAGLL
jgi:hypothetical protein